MDPPSSFTELKQLYSRYFPTAKNLLPLFLISVVVGVILGYYVSVETAYNIRFWLTPVPWLRAMGLPAGSPYFQRVLELELAHQTELVVVFLGTFFWGLPGFVVLLGEGFELGFYRATDIRFGHFEALQELLRLPQYAIGYCTIVLAVAVAYDQRCSPKPENFKDRWQRLKKNPWPLVCLMLAMLVNDFLEAFYFV